MTYFAFVEQRSHALGAEVSNQNLLAEVGVRVDASEEGVQPVEDVAVRDVRLGTSGVRPGYAPVRMRSTWRRAFGPATSVLRS